MFEHLVAVRALEVSFRHIFVLFHLVYLERTGRIECLIALATRPHLTRTLRGRTRKKKEGPLAGEPGNRPHINTIDF